LKFKIESSVTAGVTFTHYHVAMYGWDLRQSYNMLLSMGGAYRNYGKLTHASVQKKYWIIKEI
jgi:hypothetical protein